MGNNNSGEKEGLLDKAKDGLVNLKDKAKELVTPKPSPSIFPVSTSGGGKKRRAKKKGTKKKVRFSKKRKVHTYKRK